MDYIIYGPLKNPICDREMFLATAKVQLLRRLILGHEISLPSLMPSFPWALSSLSFNRPRTGQTIMRSTEVRCTCSICLGGSAQLNSCLRRPWWGGWAGDFASLGRGRGPPTDNLCGWAWWLEDYASSFQNHFHHLPLAIIEVRINFQAFRFGQMLAFKFLSQTDTFVVADCSIIQVTTRKAKF